MKSVSVSPDGTFRISQPAASNTAKGVISQVVADASNYRSLFLQNRPDMPKGWQVHHSLPQRYQEMLSKIGMIVDGGTEMAETERLWLKDQAGHSIGEGLHELFIGYLRDSGRDI